MMAFAIPKVCPSSGPLICSSVPEEIETSPLTITSQTESEYEGHKSSKKARLRLGGRIVPECESSVQRSDRIKARSGGFRKSTCQDNSCLACNALPPTLSVGDIQKLGDKVCAVDPSKTSVGMLSSKSGTQKAIGDRKWKEHAGTSGKGKEARHFPPSSADSSSC